ncbi:hypothetical protein FN976_17025 [Caenimonas sedimenti]|uniref:HMA domain-containing protein n=1 Tax=Caenimonas sedimenti TaxID=2596921 RepID=A0A562ZND3_9BURK|nr:cation transporter [Caenimonas sedimenti]TWO70043.1 hypothetical protein FN976_17025 [Caenimonas sedimenti]
MDTKTLPEEVDCCASAACAMGPPVALPTQAAGRRFRVAAMDCSAEEAEIRRALQSVLGIRSLNFQLTARTLGIDAADDALPLALEAIRKADFDPEPIGNLDPAGAHVGEGDGLHDHDHGLGAGVAQMGLALSVAVAAEVLEFIAPDTLPWRLAGMALAGLAIWLAGLDVYKKGMAALLRGKLNINALMSVAVTGAYARHQAVRRPRAASESCAQSHRGSRWSGTAARSSTRRAAG